MRNLRQRIFRASQQGDRRKVASLQKLMLRSRSNTLVSARRVAQVNQGKDTPGIDKLVAKTPEARGRLVGKVSCYQPWRAKPVRRVYIPKASGKLRLLGIPTILDRAMQAVVKNALEPEWEARFEGCSYGFRPGRGCHDAIVKIYGLAAPHRRKRWVLDADIRGAFDSIGHEQLLEAVGPFPARELVRQWLKAGHAEDGRRYPGETGTPQGGVISPLLANIAFHGMEAALGIAYTPRGENRGKRALVRYADGFVSFCETKKDAHAALPVVERLNPIVRGWANYHRVGVPKEVVVKMDRWMFQRAVKHAKHTHPAKSWGWCAKRYWGRLKQDSADRWVFGDMSRPNGKYLLKHAWTPIERHVLVKGRASPDDPALAGYWAWRARKRCGELPRKEAALARRQQGRCPACGDALLNGEELHKHHHVARRRGGGDGADNLRLVHLFCHQQIHAAERLRDA